jgi:DNA polymerase alpha subunit A
MRYEYTDKMLYNQLLYYQSLFDADKAKVNAKGEDKGMFPGISLGFLKQEANCLIVERISAAVEHNRVRFETLFGVVDKYLAKCGRQWVAMDSLFAFALA